MSKRGVLDSCADLQYLLLTLAVLRIEVNFQRGRLDVIGDIDDLLEPWHSKRHVLGRDASEVERVQGHLCCWLSETLRGYAADHLSGVDSCQVELRFDLSKDKVKRNLRKSLL